jgi:two-component sensor histidine kinase
MAAGRAVSEIGKPGQQMNNVVSISEFRPESAELLTEANHRIANHLAMVVGLIQNQIVAIRKGPEMLARETASEMLREAAAKIVSVAHLHRRFAGYCQGREIDLAELLIEGINEIVSTLAIGDRVTVRQILGNNCTVSSEHASVLALIVNEIVMNAVKYAHPTNVPVELYVRCSRTVDGRTLLEIADDGVGLPDGFNEERDGGVGLKLIRTLARRIGAKVAIESDELGLGYRFYLAPAQALDEDASLAGA